MKHLKLILFSLLLFKITVNCNVIYGNNNEYVINKEVNYKNVGEDRKWWEMATFYQIYPRSLKDSNNDGIGDLQGIIQKLPYLKETGITATWLSPIFKSPQMDMGYDISDYKAIDPIFGTMADFDKLLEEAKKLGIKIILDFVPNHTSDQHQWFNNSVNRVKGYEDFYVWHDGKVDKNGNRQPPSNWLSVPRGSAWTWNEKRQQYYYHQFAPAQPDLNFRNPAVIDSMTDVLSFWLDKGVSGFRIDAVPHIFEDKQFRDEPKNGDSKSDEYGSLNHIYTKDQDETFELIYYFRSFLDKYNAAHPGDERIIMTEAYSGFNNLIRYFGNANGSKLGAHFSFNFDLLGGIKAKMNASQIIDLVKKWQSVPKFIHWNWVLGNHDQHRIATRLGAENVDGYNMLLALFKGIQVTYNGEEIGMENGPVKCEEGQDPRAKGNCSTFDKVSRDFERTPFQWDSSSNAGFNKGAKPWLPVNPKYKTLNLALQQNISKSHYSIYKKTQEIRKEFNIVRPLEFNLMYPLGSNTVLQAAREAMENDSTKVIYSYHTIFNLGDHVQLVDLVSHSNDNNTFTVLEASANSKRKIGDTFGPLFVELLPHEALLVKYVPKK